MGGRLGFYCCATPKGSSTGERFLGTARINVGPLYNEVPQSGDKSSIAGGTFQRGRHDGAQMNLHLCFIFTKSPDGGPRRLIHWQVNASRVRITHPNVGGDDACSPFHLWEAGLVLLLHPTDRSASLGVTKHLARVPQKVCWRTNCTRDYTQRKRRMKFRRRVQPCRPAAALLR